jgi:hypothetical protein
MPKKGYTDLVFELDALVKGNTKLSETQRVSRIEQIKSDMARIQNSIGQTHF